MKVKQYLGTVVATQVTLKPRDEFPHLTTRAMCLFLNQQLGTQDWAELSIPGTQV